MRRWLAFAGRLTSILILSGFLVLSDDQRAAIAKALADPMAVLEGRSPGARDTAELRQSKQRTRISPISEALLDHEYVISPQAFEPPTDAFTETSESPLVPSPTEASPPGPPIADLPTPTQAMVGGSRGGGGGGGFLGGGSGGGGSGGSEEEGGGEDCADLTCGISTGGPEVPSIPVPEPSTWLLMISGFMSLGAALRLVRRARRNAARRSEAA